VLDPAVSYISSNMASSDTTTYYVVCLHDPCRQEGADFIASCLTKPLVEGGAQLNVRQEKMDRGGGLVLHVTASPKRLYSIAEDMDLKKPDESDIIREFRAAELASFPPVGFVGPLSLADVHKCILYAMELVHFDKEQKALPGHPEVSVMKQAPVLSSYQEAGLIDMFALHDDEGLEKLHADWRAKPFLQPPINEIRNYFGENVALYISFTSFYTAFLVPMAVLGIIHYCLDRFLRFDFIYNNVFFACLNLVAVTVFLELWKRQSNEHAFYFGTAAFRGEYGLNPVTGRDEVQYPMKKTVKKLVLVSLPVTLVCLLVAFALMLMSFESEHMVTEYLRDPYSGEVANDLISQGLTYVPTIVYSILVFVMNLKYLHLAHWLTEWENHRTQEQFERHVVAKLVIFEFVNTFLALFYIAFYLQDIPMLKSQVFTMLIVMQIVNQLQETILPIVLKRPSTRRVMNKIAKKVHKEGDKSKPCEHRQVDFLGCISTEDSQVRHAMWSLQRDPYESTYDDFMELWLQFGHVFLFSSVYPLAAFFALINNIVELRMDAYKLARVMRKPTPRSNRDIGAWYAAFSITSIISVMTNCTLLAMDKDVQDFAPESSNRDWILLFVVIEHLFLAIRVVIDKSIPDVSKKVKLAMDRNDYLLKNR
jgi:anoctamin-10